MCTLPRSLPLWFLSGAAVFLLAGSAEAQGRGPGPQALQRPAPPPNRMPGSDWWRIYPWSPYNYGRNPYNPIRYPYVVPYPVYTPYAAPVMIPGTTAYPAPASGAGGSPSPVPVPNPSGPVKDPPENAAVIRLAVPDRFADVWFDGVKTSSVGTTRYYVTPPLGGGPHQYEVTARWRRGGQPVTAKRQLEVGPGQTAVVDFTGAGQGK
jgi:uncharacterized protein (TIGR03000 family)